MRLLQRKCTRGFTLIEAVIVLGIIAILAALATPYFSDWIQNARYREAARNIASALREARSTAISRNRECRIEFDIPGRQYRMTLGNRSNESSDWTLLRGYAPLPGGVTLKGTDECDSDGNFNLEFNPKGTAGGASYTVCIMDNSPIPAEKFKVSINQTTGRIHIE